MRISDWSSDVCSSDLQPLFRPLQNPHPDCARQIARPCSVDIADHLADGPVLLGRQRLQRLPERLFEGDAGAVATHHDGAFFHRRGHLPTCTAAHGRSEEHTSELQSLMRISYAVFCLKKKK